VPTLQPPRRENIPLWLALLLKRQKRANIIPPPWLAVDSLSYILRMETEIKPEAFSAPPKLPGGRVSKVISPPFLPSSTSDAASNAIPYHWLELGEILLEAASDDFEDANQVRGLLRDLREARLAKLRIGVESLGGGSGIQMNGVGGMELAEGRSFISGVIDGLRYVCLQFWPDSNSWFIGKLVLPKSKLKQRRRKITLHTRVLHMTMRTCCLDS
jgi:GINS complex subunit 2